MKTGFLKVLWVISGILLIFAGMLSFLYPQSAVMTIAFIFGLIMLITGIFDIIIYFTIREYMLGAGWILVDGVLTSILSVLLLGNDFVTANVIPYIFAMWMLFSGVTKFISSFDLKKLNINGWGWLSLLGILGTVLGFICFLQPIVAANILGILMGIIFVFQGCFALYMWWICSRFPSNKL